MADMMHKPILGLIENYSYFQCPNCGERHSIFGESKLEKVAADLGLKVLAQLPMDPELAQAIDRGQVESIETETNYLAPVAEELLKL